VCIGLGIKVCVGVGMVEGDTLSSWLDGDLFGNWV
jgi:hypothetical protein